MNPVREFELWLLHLGVKPKIKVVVQVATVAEQMAIMTAICGENGVWCVADGIGIGPIDMNIQGIALQLEVAP